MAPSDAYDGEEKDPREDAVSGSMEEKYEDENGGSRGQPNRLRHRETRFQTRISPHSWKRPGYLEYYYERMARFRILVRDTYQE